MKPAIFNTAMVRAILDGRKTNTRRLDKNFPDPDMSQLFNCGTSKDGFLYAHFSNGKAVKAPYKVGDIIYVRETFCIGTYEEDDSPYKEYWFIAQYADSKTVFYKADIDYRYSDDDSLCKWKPSIYMPKEYARLFLRVKDVRIERLNEISEEDAQKEGIEYAPVSTMSDQGIPSDSFGNLWESIYGNGSFDNRYVWVIEFERISKEEAISETAT